MHFSRIGGLASRKRTDDFIKSSSILSFMDPVAVSMPIFLQFNRCLVESSVLSKLNLSKNREKKKIF